MNKEFENAMSKRTDAELSKMINSQPGDYQLEAVKAAEEEIKKREFIREKLSKYSDEQILAILKSRENYETYEFDATEAEAKKRNLKFDYEEVKIEDGINQEMQRLKTDVIYERYPALKFISGFYRVLAWICFVGSIITFIYLLTQGKLGIPLAIGTILIGGILFVTFLAIAEGIKLFMDIAQNTRITAINSKK